MKKIKTNCYKLLYILFPKIIIFNLSFISHAIRFRIEKIARAIRFTNIKSRTQFYRFTFCYFFPYAIRLHPDEFKNRKRKKKSNVIKKMYDKMAIGESDSFSTLASIYNIREYNENLEDLMKILV